MLDRRMRALLTRWFMAVATAMVCAGAPRVVLAQAERPADVAIARELFSEGLELSRQEQWEEARVKLAKSLSLKRTALTFYTLAVAEKNSGHLVASLEHFRAFLAQPTTAKTEGFVAPARTSVAELEPRVAGLVVVVDPPEATGLTVLLDGESVPVAGFGRRRLVDPGAHRVTARAEGFFPSSRQITLAEGEQQELTLVLQPMPVADKPGAEAPFPTAAVVLLAGGAVVGGVGLVLGILGVEEAKDAPTRDGEAADAARTKTIAGDVLMATGGAVAAVGLILLIVELTDTGPAAEPPSPAAWALHPWARGSVGGVELRF